jgi:hypothetical protein
MFASYVLLTQTSSFFLYTAGIVLMQPINDFSQTYSNTVIPVFHKMLLFFSLIWVWGPISFWSLCLNQNSFNGRLLRNICFIYTYEHTI